jgi:hypothetical protein
MTPQQKQQLIEALRNESEMLKERHGKTTTDHDLAIIYLETGGLPAGFNDDYCDERNLKILYDAVYQVEELIDIYL